MVQAKEIVDSDNLFSVKISKNKLYSYIFHMSIYRQRDIESACVCVCLCCTRAWFSRRLNGDINKSVARRKQFQNELKSSKKMV